MSVKTDIDLRYFLVAFLNGKRVAETDITDEPSTEIEAIVMEWERLGRTWGYEYRILHHYNYELGVQNADKI